VELAGELAAAAPGKRIRLAHRGPRLVENLSPRASAEALSQLKALGVNVLLNTLDAKPTEDEVVYDATSPEAATGFLASTQPGVLDDRGRIIVNERFQVRGHPHWFAVGDANAAPYAKQAVAATSQGGYVAKFLLGSGKPFRPQPLIALVPLGNKLGFSQMPFGVVKWKFLLNLKRKDYLVERIRTELGAT
jgi:NADH dehydrogenase FAD-containing subunit